MSEDMAEDGAGVERRSRANEGRGKPAPERQGSGTDWWAEIKGILWLVLAVLGFHSFIAKPFYIPSESMLPALLVGDRLVVTKYPYGWSFVSPTFHPSLPFIQRAGLSRRRMPERGDVVIVTPPGTAARLYQARDRPARRHARRCAAAS